MAEIIDRHNPSWALFPVNNDRTAWRKFGLPVVLVIPHMRDAAGTPNNEAAVLSIGIAVEGAPQNSLVAGHDHVGLRYPDREVYSQSISTQDLLIRLINQSIQDYFDAEGNDVAYEDAIEGNTFKFTTSSGITDTIAYLPDANYYDLSDILIETESLPQAHYNLIYSTSFYVRIVAKQDTAGAEELICININQTGVSTLRFGLNHPGEVISDFARHTPAVNLTNNTRSADSTIGFYRPFTDALQDIYDEQKFLRKLNWVNQVQYQAIPYLSQLLGWDVPYFPDSLDQLRRLILKRTRSLQNLKGSNRAIRELLNLFGFTVLISNLWYSKDGKRFIAPAEKLPPDYRGQEIVFTEKYQVDPILASYTTNGFGEITAPLLFRPQKVFGQEPFEAVQDSADMTITAYLVEVGSAADDVLKAIVESIESVPDTYGQSAQCTVSDIGVIEIGAINSAMSGLEVTGYSQLLMEDGVVTDQTLVGSQPPFRIINQSAPAGVTFNKNLNALKVTFSTYLNFSTDGTTLYAFVAYKRQEIEVPAELSNLRSNRFTIQILNREDEQPIRGDVLDFVIDFVHRIKAFHSILEVIKYHTDIDDTYLVTDMCLGGDISQRFDVALGRQQVPPAIIPNITGESCDTLTPEGQGYKDSDILYRRLLLGAIIEEYGAWRELSDRDIVQSALLRLATPPAQSSNECKYTHLGQDRVVGDRTSTTRTEYTPDPNANKHTGYQDLAPPTAHQTISNGQFDKHPGSSDKDTSVYSSVNVEYDSGQTAWCKTDGKTDYCFKGRVQDETLLQIKPAISDFHKPKQCGPSLGAGVYWAYPSLSVRIVAGVRRPVDRSRKSVYSGGSSDTGQLAHLNSIQSENLTVGTEPIPAKFDNFLGRLLRSYGQPQGETIHFTNRDGIDSFEQSRNLAIQRPSLDIEIPYLHFPGCRFAMLNKLIADFSHDTIRARPWDKSPCDGSNWLNAAINTRANGDTYLTYDDLPYEVLGNGLVSDIGLLGDHSFSAYASEQASVVHKIYSTSAASHPAIALSDVIDEPATGDSIITTDDPLFASAKLLGTNGYLDFIDGYPSSVGYFIHTGTDLGREGLYDDLFVALGIPGVEFGQTGGTASTRLLFKLGDGIRDTSSGFRLDCGCEVVEETSSDLLACASSKYLNQDGVYDWDGDHVWVYRNMTLEEEYGVETYLLDGTIPSLLEVIT